MDCRQFAVFDFLHRRCGSQDLPDPELSDESKKAFDVAYSNIKAFHTAQIAAPMSVETMPGVTCRRISRPIGGTPLSTLSTSYLHSYHSLFLHSRPVQAIPGRSLIPFSPCHVCAHLLCDLDNLFLTCTTSHLQASSASISLMGLQPMAARPRTQLLQRTGFHGFGVDG